MSDPNQADRPVGSQPRNKGMLKKARGPLWCLVLGVVMGTWIGGGPDRYGEEEGIVGGFRGAARSLTKAFRYTAATLRDCLTYDQTSVRKLGLTQQIETRLGQDKRLVADSIIVEVEDGGTAVLKGIVPDEFHKEKAVALTRDTRGVEKVVDELAVRPSARTINTVPAAPVPTGVASNGRDVH
jgi:hypothetical protein